jgi:hypothetical protein
MVQCLVHYHHWSTYTRICNGQERYAAYLKHARDAALGACTSDAIKKPSVKVGALLPHEVTTGAVECYERRLAMQEPSDEISTEISNLRLDDAKDTLFRQQMQFDLQWHGLVQGLRSTCATSAKGWVPICDVSGSMSGQPMDVAIALSLLLAEVNSQDSGWYGKMFTFSTEPALITIFEDERPDSLEAVLAPASLSPISVDNTDASYQFVDVGDIDDDGPAEEFMDFEMADDATAPSLRDIGAVAVKVGEMDWGGSTDLLKTMQLYCDVAIAHGTTNAEMENQGLVIFSDMQFNMAIHGSSWDTTHAQIVQIFRGAGYTEMPKLIFWNLRSTGSLPVQQDARGVILLSGFSAQLLKSFLAGDLAAFTPAAQLRSILDMPAYGRLLVA